MKHIFLFWCLGIALSACDTTHSDDLAPQADLPAPAYYTADPFSPLLIDISDLIQGATFQIHELPAHGELQLWEEALLIYTPHTDFLDGEDRFSYRIITEGQVRTGQIRIQMDPQRECIWRPRSDSLFVHPNKAIRYNLLANDLFCGASSGSAEKVSIRIKPRYGTATLSESGQLHYQPTDSLTTQDRFAYRICHPETGVCKDALVQIRPQYACADAAHYHPITNLPPSQPITNTATALREATITDDCLRLAVSYSGGCGGTIRAQLVVENTQEQQLQLALRFSEDDRCEAIVSQHLFFDLTTLNQEPPLRITISGYPDTLFYNN